MCVEYNNKDAFIIIIIIPVIHLYCPLYKYWSRMNWGGNGLQHSVDPTGCGLTQALVFQTAPFSTPTLHAPLTPRHQSEARTHQWAPVWASSY